MNFFEQELRKLADAGITPDNATFAGRACYVDLGGQNCAKIQFTTTGVSEHYSALAVDILNRTDGKVDSLRFRFGDVWGKKPTPNPNFSDGIMPHIWTDRAKSEWYVYKPTPADFKQLAEAVSDYLSVFTERDAEREKSAFNKAISRGKDKSETYKSQKSGKSTKTNTKNKEALK
ncbi:hypothetical protein FACS1894133_3580 [Clostridia bacterium]|nr:hypothetical protein FACS1894133_3580 [Clostridia bacterium]